MKKLIKRRWLKALVSGKYKHCKNVLHNLKNEFDVLGVLCDIYIQETDLGWWEAGPTCYTLISDVDNYMNDKLLSPHVVKWAGLDSICPYANKIPLTDYNDGLGKIQCEFNLRQIAQIVEEYL